MMSEKEFMEQWLVLEKTERWILREFRRQMRRRACAGRTKAMAELSARAAQLVAEGRKLAERIEL